jgi:hypothetical protein
MDGPSMMVKMKEKLFHHVEFNLNIISTHSRRRVCYIIPGPEKAKAKLELRIEMARASGINVITILCDQRKFLNCEWKANTERWQQAALGYTTLKRFGVKSRPQEEGNETLSPSAHIRRRKENR